MESAKAIQNFIGPVLEKHQIDFNLPHLMVRFEDTVGNQIAIYRFHKDSLYVDQSFEENDRRDAIEMSLCVRGDDWIPTSYSRGKYSLCGVDSPSDAAKLEEAQPKTMKKVAQKCEAWVNKIVKSNGCYDCLNPVMVQYLEGKIIVKKLYPMVVRTSA